MINHRYNILEEIGAGGSGEVFLAEDLCRRNQKVALKILHAAEKAGLEADEAFQNEVSSLVSLSHPFLVQIFDFGTIRHAEQASLVNRRFFTMEFVRGRDTLKVVESIESIDEKERRLEHLLLQTLSVLSYIHHEGTIHFDIKPDNLIVVSDDSATPVLKLMDFGFSKKSDGSSDVSIRGTLEYTAPELLKGETFDHRVDLYSLGATFYQLLVGRPPLESNSAVDLAKRIVTEDVSVSKVVGRSSNLTGVIDALLQKSPDRRCASAEDAAQMLVSRLSNGKELFESYFGYARTAKFIGRKAELETLHRAVSSLTEKDSGFQRSAILICGTEGIGKTSLMSQTLRFARTCDLPVYEMEIVQSGVPFEAVASMLGVMVADLRSMSDEGREVFRKFDQIIGLDGEQRSQYERWGQKSETFVELLSRFLIESAEVFPYVLAADNAQFLDEASASVLRMTARDSKPGNLLIIAAETSEKGTILSPSIAHEMDLTELAIDEIAEMTHSLLGNGRLSNEIGASIYNLYGGTPGVVVEALNAVRELVPQTTPTEEINAREYLKNLESHLPKSIDSFLLGRYEKLGREQQLVLSVLSCFLFPVKMNVLEQVLPFHSQRTADHIRFLQLDGIIGTSGNGLFIRMKRLKDSIYERIKDEQVDLHKMIAAKLETDAMASSGFDQLQELAFQFSGGKEYERASMYFERAADEGMGLFAFQRALHLYREGISAAGQISKTGKPRSVEVKYASALYKAGSYRDAIDQAKKLIQDSTLKLSERLVLFKVLGLASSRLGENEQAQEHLNTVMQMSSDKVEQLELRQELVGLEISAGQFEVAEKDCLEQLRNASDLNTDRLTGAIYTDLGIATFFQDRFDYAAECFGEALKRYEVMNERTQVINSMINIGNALSAKGDHAKAIDCWQGALKTSEEFGTLNQQAQIQNNLGIAHYNLKMYGKAKQLYSDARRKYERIGSTVGNATVLINLGEVSLVEGEYEASLSRFNDAIDLFAGMENSYYHAQSCLLAAQALLMMGKTKTADARLSEAEVLIIEKNQESFFARFKYLKGLVHLADGEYGAASTHFQEVIGRLRSEKGGGLLWDAQLRLVEGAVKSKQFDDALGVVKELKADVEAMKKPAVVAETDYLLGMIASLGKVSRLENPIVYYKHGIEALSKEPVSELTWKLLFALAREYYERGQRERAKEYLTKTKIIIEFFLSHFKSEDYKRSYLAVDQKERILNTIASILNSQ